MLCAGLPEEYWRGTTSMRKKMQAKHKRKKAKKAKVTHTQRNGSSYREARSCRREPLARFAAVAGEVEAFNEAAKEAFKTRLATLLAVSATDIEL